ncbi:DUF5686 family protein [Aequorivita lipolytica]|uniref:Bacterial surface antigen (D15) domain-containing protein n=1 Tax=Aequorivita lipolytica TaxID=153267 RepID=A0A5C6YSN1_9FLAO|nr:DUF5686 family protein [Aequorivita lipolytica]TXD70551.1 hypothetical protein ESV24_00195 [Aequorivita lipolytica]SRX49576.1 hypothetical protein AEQU2_00038 [Aequorivita lipolytica]
MRKLLFLVFFSIAIYASAQEPAIQSDKDTISSIADKKEHPLSSGYYPVGFFDIDLKTLIKLNNYEGLRLGIGGFTNDKLFENYRLGGYFAYGFKDKTSKFSLGAGALVNKEKIAWVNVYYADDVKEIGSFDYLTDARVYSIFEPRLVNITQFYKYRKWYANIASELTPKILGEFRVEHSNVENIETYYFINDGIPYTEYQLAEATVSFRISPKTNFFTNEDGTKEYFDGFPKISAQITQGFKDVVGSDFNYTKFGLKLDYYIKRTDLSSTNILLEGSLATGDVPLTHLFHSYPNQPTKDEVLQRFSVAGVQSFETMYFGEFFSDKLTTLQVKHSLRRFELTEKWNPELVLITRHALGDMSNTEQHFGIPFNTLDKLYNESGFEINKIIFGFGLSGAYRYGYYNLPNFADNISFKFTFYLQL